MDKKCSLESMPEEEVEVRFQLKARTLEGLLVYEKGSRKLMVSRWDRCNRKASLLVRVRLSVRKKLEDCG